jgi:hypothetical protein
MANQMEKMLKSLETHIRNQAINDINKQSKTILSQEIHPYGSVKLTEKLCTFVIFDQTMILDIKTAIAIRQYCLSQDTKPNAGFRTKLALVLRTSI